MAFDRIRSFTLLISALALVMFADAQAVSGQMADVAGTWTFTVTTDTGVTNPVCTIEQDGETLSGVYSSDALGRNNISGTVDGMSVTISFSADLGGQAVPVVYRATVDDDGNMSGTLDIADGALGGTFTATRGDG